MSARNERKRKKDEDTTEEYENNHKSRKGSGVSRKKFFLYLLNKFVFKFFYKIILKFFNFKNFQF